MRSGDTPRVASVNATGTHSVASMAARRRPRGTLVDPVLPGWRIERAAKERVETLARNAGVSAAVMVELLTQHVEVTDQGIPVWMPEHDRREELPISAA